jgi:cadmium resistance transport/sequestration family protein
MNWFVFTLIAAITSFAATNIDDIVILMLFFGQVNSKLRPQHIVVGQYLGFLVLILVSLPGFLGGLVIPKTWIGLLGFVPIVIGLKQFFNQINDQTVQAVSDELNSSPSDPSKLPSFKSLLAPQTYHVAAVTFANGGDNIGIYVPLFANSTLPGLVVMLSVFFAMKGLWCMTAYQLVRYPLIAEGLTRYGQQFVPFILIGLGVFILVDSGTYQLLPF